MRPYFIAETAFHHEGDFDFVKALIDAAAQSGADAVKYQLLFNIESFFAPSHSATDVIRPMMFSPDEWSALFEYTIAKDLDIVAMPLDLESVRWLREHPTRVAWTEIHSVSVGDSDLIDALQALKIPIYVGAGGRTITELKQLDEQCRGQLKAIMHGFQSFPTDFSQLRLGRLKRLKGMFPNHALGYADHSSPKSPVATSISTAAFILGAHLFERHLTTQPGSTRTDHNSAISTEEFSSWRQTLLELHRQTNIEDPWDFSEAESTYRSRSKVLIATQDIEEGEVLTRSNVAMRITESLSGIRSLNVGLGRRVKHRISSGNALLESDLAGDS